MKHILENITYHAVHDDAILDALRYAHAHGLAGVQVAVELPHLSFESLSDRQCHEIDEFRRAHQLRIALHAPDFLAPLLPPTPALTEAVFAYLTALLAFAHRIGAAIVTCHPGPIPSFGTDTSPRQPLPPQDQDPLRRTLAENLRRLVHLVDARVLLCFENFGMTPMVRDALKPHLDKAELALCWDLPKTYDARGNIDQELENYFWHNVDRIKQVHLHDLRDGRSHCVIGTGRLDLMRFLPRLARASVADWCIEVRPRDKALESLENLQGIILAETRAEPPQS
ncbi:MAG: sugar phosphate isomerase/epimerase [Phycisphaerae bacterium]|nr:sugar phosphate isomerase/epimerase [Phycisphaerae bacterium]